MRITVRKEHIDSARKKDSHHCMIADAVAQQTNGKYVLVDVQTIRFSSLATGERFTYLTPPIAQNAILRWDKGIDVQPFTFTLANPSIRRIARTADRDPTKLKAARDRYETKRKVQKGAPRLVKKTRPKVSRFREFGVRQYTQE